VDAVIKALTDAGIKNFNFESQLVHVKSDKSNQDISLLI
jgi:hypothetical protein